MKLSEDGVHFSVCTCAHICAFFVKDKFVASKWISECFACGGEASDICETCRERLEGGDIK
jgi:hypothetical protein